MSVAMEEEGDQWFSYLLSPDKLPADLEAGLLTEEQVKNLLKEFLTNLLTNQATTQGLFTDNPQELWYGKAGERVELKSLVLKALSLRLGSYLGWRVSVLESCLAPPLLLYLLTALLQSQPEQYQGEQGMEQNSNQPPNLSFADTRAHPDLDLSALAVPGPALHSLILLHRWVIRTFMAIKTPQRTERTSNVMVPGVKRDPALMFRDQTNTLVFAVVQTSIKLLSTVLSGSLSPASLPSYHSFPCPLAPSTSAGYVVSSWDPNRLVATLAPSCLATVAYDLGCCYFFCEDYPRAKHCFTQYLSQQAEGGTQGGEVDEARLSGYLLCLDMEQPNLPKPKVGVLEQVVTCGAPQLPELVCQDTLGERQVVTSGELRELASPQPELVVASLVRRSLGGAPLTIGDRQQVGRLGVAGLRQLHTTLATLLKQADKAEHVLLMALLQELLLTNTLPPSSPVFSLLPPGQLQQWAVMQRQGQGYSKPPPLSLQTFGDERLESLNHSLSLLSTWNPGEVMGLVNRLGRQARKVTNRWGLDTDLQARQNTLPDSVFVLLAKISQLKKLKRFHTARTLLAAVHASVLSSGKAPSWLALAVENEGLAIELLASRDSSVGGGNASGISGRCVATLTSEQPPPPHLVTSCLVHLLSQGDWDSVTRLTPPNPSLTYPGSMRAAGSPHLTTVTLARNLATLMINLRVNNQQTLKKVGRDVWDSVALLVSQGSNKRGKGEERGMAAAHLARDRAMVSSFLARVSSHTGLATLVLSLLASLFNCARDDPNTDLTSPHSSIWPTGLPANQSIQERTVEELLSSVLSAALSHSPTDPLLLLLSADLEFACSRYPSALARYVESTAVRTDFFREPWPEPPSVAGELVAGEVAAARMVTCCKEMGRLTQAVVLSQFSQDPNYAQAFKFLEDQTEDGGEALYGCIWDMAILEFCMSLHTRRGEVARRKEARSCIWQLELNTNNDEEIIKEAANVRKAMFLRSLALQFF